MNKTSFALAFGLVFFGTGTTATADVFTFVDFSSHANARLQDFPEPVPFFPTGGIFLPDALTGKQTLNGIPFNIPTAGNASRDNAWNAFTAGRANPRVLDIITDINNINKVYTLIDSYWGIPGPTAFAFTEFFGSKGAYFRKDLVGGVDIRDYNNEPPAIAAWTHTINGTTTVEALSYDTIPNGVGQVLDMQIIPLPDAFLTQDLTEIRVTDIGIDLTQAQYLAGDRHFQRIFVAGITVSSGPTEAVPEPSSFLLLLAAILSIGALSYSRKQPPSGRSFSTAVATHSLHTAGGRPGAAPVPCGPAVEAPPTSPLTPDDNRRTTRRRPAWLPAPAGRPRTGECDGRQHAAAVR